MYSIWFQFCFIINIIPKNGSGQTVSEMLKLDNNDRVIFCILEHTECKHNPCQNGGTCHQLYNVTKGPRFECECVDGYTGVICHGKYIC